MGILQKENSALNTRMRKTQRLCFDVTITADATPADKTHATDLPGVVYLRTEGLTAEADAIESGTYTTADDGTGVFGVLIDLGDNPADKIYKLDLQVDTGEITGTAALTSNGRIALDLDSDQDISSQDITVTVVLDYREE